MYKPASLIITTILLVAFPLTVQAGITGLILSDSYENPVAVLYKMRAEYVAQTVKITSKEREFTSKLRDLSNAKKYLEEQVKKEKQIVLLWGPAYLYPGSKKFLSSTSYHTEPQLEVYLLLSIADDSDDIFSGGAKLAAFVEKLQLPDGIKFHPSAVRLAVEDPEKLRGTILELISADVEATRELLKGTGKITVSGLEGPVKVNQVDDINVELFIEYKVSLEIE